MRVLWVVFVCLLSAAGCYAPPSYQASSPSAGLPAVNSEPTTPTIKQDAYATSINVEARGGEQTAGSTSQLFGLYGTINKKTGATVVYVQWAEIYAAPEWRFYSRASTNKGQELSMATVDRKVGNCHRTGNCIYTETYNIMMPAADLKAGATSGVSFKIYGKRGDERVVNLPAPLIESFNAKMIEAAKLRTAS